MKDDFIMYNLPMSLFCISVVTSIYSISTFANTFPNISVFVEKGVCSINIDDEVIDNYKCDYSRAPLALSYSYLYEADKQILVFIDRPIGNSCDGGPLHIFSKTESDRFKPLKIIDFCGGHYPSITAGPGSFKISIPSGSIDGTSKIIPAETWELKNDELVKK